MENAEQAPVVWNPTEDILRNCHMGQYQSWLEAKGEGPFADFHALHKWSTTELETFWQSIWD